MKNGVLGLALGGLIQGDNGMPIDSGIWFVNVAADGAASEW
jgi:hypothetical protein